MQPFLRQVEFIKTLFAQLGAPPENLTSEATSMCNTTFLLFDNIILRPEILALRFISSFA
jgi:hypothetical protein